MIKGREIGGAEVRFAAYSLIPKDLLKFIIWLAGESLVFNKPTRGRREDKERDGYLREFLNLLFTRPI